MIRPYFVFVLIACSLALFRPVFASLSAKELLLESSAYFDKGQYKKALLTIESLDIRADFDNSDDMKLAFKIRAIAYEQTGDSEHSQETIRELFFLDPNYQFNPYDTPNSVVMLAQKEKAAIEEKNQHLASIKNESRHDPSTARDFDHGNASKNERIVLIEKRPSHVTTLFPFGINHFYLQSPVKGGIYLSLQTLSLATNIAAFWWKQSYLLNFGGAFVKQPSYKGSFDTAQTIQYIGLGALLISYGISVIDALIRFHSMPTQKVSLNEITSRG